MEKGTVLIIDQIYYNELKERLEKNSDFKIMGCTNNPDVGFTMAERLQPEVILLNVDHSDLDGLAVAEIFAMELPGSSLILTTSSDSKRVLRHALYVGAKDVISFPVDDDHLYRVINRVVMQEKKRRKMFKVQKIDRPQFKTIAVFGTKGGVGKTTLALNLAIAIRQETKKRVALVDLDLMSGNIALMSGITSKRTLKDLIDEVNSLDEELIDRACVSHSSGIKILPAPLNPEFASLVEAEQVEKVLDKLSQAFNYVIIDLPSFIHDPIIPALEKAQDILTLTTLDLASIQNLKQSVELLAGLSMRSKVKIVANRSGSSGGIKISDLEDELGMAIKFSIPDCEKQAINAVNLGEPLVLSAKGLPAVRKIEELARNLVVKADHAQMETNDGLKYSVK